ncbi:MAG: pyruvate formate lyase-activating protein [Opitutales bacterium]|nr:pyruvate formate lyase-activating protein [Opitutales bacterium]
MSRTPGARYQQEVLPDILARVPNAEGVIHSVETGGTVDGPGIRFVLFTSGCPLACQYCHNPDTRFQRYGKKTDAHTIIRELARYRPFLKRANGGLTISGGEPLVQPEFIKAVLLGARLMELHTALDTTGYLENRATPDIMELVDLVLLDIKSWEPTTYRKVTGRDLTPTLRFAERLNRENIPVWIRFVLVPGLTDEAKNIEGVARYCSDLTNLQRLEVLPFHNMGKYKWQALGLEYHLETTPEPSTAETEAVRAVFARHCPHIPIR